MVFQKANFFFFFPPLFAIYLQEASKKNPGNTHTQLILPIHRCVTLSHFTSEETQAQNDLFDLQQTYQEIRKESKNRSLFKVQPKV